MAAPQLTPDELLAAVSFALNMVRNTRLHGCPHGFKDTYELAAEVDRHIAAQRNTLKLDRWGQAVRPFNPDTHNDRVGPWPDDKGER